MSEVKTWQHRINDADFHATREELMQAEINELRAHISALESQEPIGEVSGNDWSTALLWKDREPGSPVYAEAGAAPVPEGWRSAVAMAYGHLWHVNNEPMAPIPLRSEESASYAARKLLRDLMTTKERGEAINAVQKLLTAAPVQQEQASFPTIDAELWLTKNKLATHGVLGAAPAAKVPEDAP